ETEQYNDDETYREDERSHEWLPGRNCAGECEARGHAENGARQHPSNNEIGGRQRELATSRLGHRGRDVSRLHIIHRLLLGCSVIRLDISTNDRPRTNERPGQTELSPPTGLDP